MRVLVTRAVEDAGALSEPLRAAGHEPVEVPLIRKELLDWAADGAFDWLVLTSPTAVTALDRGRFSRPSRVAAVGPGTAARAEAAGLAVSLVPEAHTGAALAAALGDLSGQRVLYPRAEEVTPWAIRGADVVDVVAYRNVEPEGTAEALARVWPVDLATATSASAARRLAAGLASAGLQPVPVVAIGPSTADAVRQSGLPLAATADPHTIPGLLAAVSRLAAQ